MISQRYSHVFNGSLCIIILRFQHT